MSLSDGHFTTDGITVEPCCESQKISICDFGVVHVYIGSEDPRIPIKMNLKKTFKQFFSHTCGSPYYCKYCGARLELHDNEKLKPYYDAMVKSLNEKGVN